MANIVLKVSGPDSASTLKASLKYGNEKSNLPKFLRAFGESVGSNPKASVQILNGDDVAASATIAVVVANMTANDTIQIGAMTLTAKASGASTNEFNIGVSDTATATNLKTAIQAYSSDLLTASSSAGTVTVSAAITGPLGNAIPIIVTEGTPGGMTPSAAALSGGVNDTASAIDYRNF